MPAYLPCQDPLSISQPKRSLLVQLCMFYARHALHACEPCHRPTADDTCISPQVLRGLWPGESILNLQLKVYREV